MQQEQQQQKSGFRAPPVLLIMAVLVIIVIILLSGDAEQSYFTARNVYENKILAVFSFVTEKLGEGGFGCNFKGALPGSTLVAVKKLKCLGQGEKQFRAEVQTIGMINHKNLYRLLGFCADSNSRLLVYECMEKGSLNSHLFSKGSAKLSWELQYHIALGTARGLAYLHEECKDCIIH
jgi:hypothetical protein